MKISKKIGGILVLLLVLGTVEVTRGILLSKEERPITGLFKPSDLDCVLPWDYGKYHEDFGIKDVEGLKGWRCELTSEWLQWKRI